MNQENTNGRIADDFPAIAARMRELGAQSRQVPAWVECDACDNRGWVWSQTTLDWRRCLHCGMPQRRPKPHWGR